MGNRTEARCCHKRTAVPSPRGGGLGRGLSPRCLTQRPTSVTAIAGKTKTTTRPRISRIELGASETIAGGAWELKMLGTSAPTSQMRRKPYRGARQRHNAIKTPTQKEMALIRSTNTGRPGRP